MMARPTAPILQYSAGNRLFARAVTVLGLHESLGRRLVAEVLATVGSSPLAVTVDELGLLLPEIERRLLLLVPHEKAKPSLARLRRTLLVWED